MVPFLKRLLFSVWRKCWPATAVLWNQTGWCWGHELLCKGQQRRGKSSHANSWSHYFKVKCDGFMWPVLYKWLFTCKNKKIINYWNISPLLHINVYFLCFFIWQITYKDYIPNKIHNQNHQSSESKILW